MTAGRKQLLLVLVAFSLLGLIVATVIPSSIDLHGHGPFTQRKRCCNNMRWIDNAKEQFVSLHQATNGTLVSEGEITQFMKGGIFPKCPSGGKYEINPIDVDPVCSFHGRYSVVLTNW
jgi:hypothetical protein